MDTARLKAGPAEKWSRDIALWALWLSQFRKLSSLSGWAIWGDATIDSQFSVYSGSEIETGDIVSISMLDLITAKIIYYLLVPLAQFALAVFIADTRQYFTHRIVHENHYLYSELYRPFHNLQSTKAADARISKRAKSFLKIPQPTPTLFITVYVPFHLCNKYFVALFTQKDCSTRGVFCDAGRAPLQRSNPSYSFPSSIVSPF